MRRQQSPRVHVGTSCKILLIALCFLAGDRKSTRLNSSHQIISYAVFCLKKKNVTPVSSPRTLSPSPLVESLALRTSAVPELPMSTRQLRPIQLGRVDTDDVSTTIHLALL